MNARPRAVSRLPLGLLLVWTAVGGCAQLDRLPAGIPGVCARDHGVRGLAKTIDEELRDAHVHAKHAMADSLTGLGWAVQGAQLRAQANDAAARPAPAAAVSLGEVQTAIGMLRGAFADRRVQAARLDQQGLAWLARARVHLFLAYLKGGLAGLRAVELSMAAKKAISADKTCVASLAPLVQPVANLGSVGSTLWETHQILDQYTQARGLPPMTPAEQRSLVAHARVEPHLAASLLRWP